MLDWRRVPVSSAPCTNGTSPAPMATCPGTSCWEAFQTRRVARASRSAHRRHGPQCRRAGPEPPAWWQRGQPMQLTMAAVAEHVAVQEDIASVAAEPAGDEPATAGDGAGDAAGDGAVTTSQLSPAQSGSRRTCSLR